MPDQPKVPTWAEDWIILPFLVFGDRMLALLALLCFVLALFDVAIGVDLVVLGLAFVAAHLLLGLSITPWRK